MTLEFTKYLVNIFAAKTRTKHGLKVNLSQLIRHQICSDSNFFSSFFSLSTYWCSHQQLHGKSAFLLFWHWQCGHAHSGFVHLNVKLGHFFWEHGYLHRRYGHQSLDWKFFWSRYLRWKHGFLSYFCLSSHWCLYQKWQVNSASIWSKFCHLKCGHLCWECGHY